eukprot:SAG31_NODE_3542_length_4143_cov_2.092977_7_plen_50_part_00
MMIGMMDEIGCEFWHGGLMMMMVMLPVLEPEEQPSSGSAWRHAECRQVT